MASADVARPDMSRLIEHKFIGRSGASGAIRHRRRRSLKGCSLHFTARIQ